MAENLSVLNNPPHQIDGPDLLHQLIRWDDYSSTCALDFATHDRRERYTYQQLKLLVDSFKKRIDDILSRSRDQMGFSRQHIIPLLLPQAPCLYISQLAILETGGAFCPINLDAPRDRIKFVVGDVSASVIITTSEFEDVVSWEDGPAVLVVDEFPSPQILSGPQEPRYLVQPHDIAYVMYTSGSSGTPKGVAVSHLAVTQSLLAHEKHIPQFKRFLQFAAPSFDVSVFEIFFPLKRGCTLVGCNRSRLLNDLPGMVNVLEVDAAELTPTVAGSLLQKRSNAPGLKLLLTIGEMLTRPIIAEFGGSETRQSILYGMYGPTEAAIHCTIYPAMPTDAKPANIGLPLDTVSTFVAAAATNAENAQMLKLLPKGELGELVLGGPQLAHGYLNREEQNRAAFVNFEGNFYYRTGDRARFLEDGTVEIHGRMSAGQIKLRGQRAELGEIEDAVYKHPGVKTVVASVLGSALVAFALVHDDDIETEQVFLTCAKWLPKFMIPSEIVLVQKFPYLPSGKVDKRRLQADFEENREADDAEQLEPVTATEKDVKKMLVQLLGPFPSSMRLSAAGLDSLIAIRAATMLREMGFNLTTISILQADSLGALAHSCEESKSSPKSIKVIQRFPKENFAYINDLPDYIESTVPCTPLQSAMLSETLLEAKAYQNWIELHLPSVDSTDHVISAFCLLAKKNPILRSGFAESQDSDGFNQVIWRTFPENHIELVNEFKYNIIYPERKIFLHPLRLQICCVGDGIRILMQIHHALYDAWSLELLLDDFDALLASNSVIERTPFAAIQEAYLDESLLPNIWHSRDYWKDHLAHLDIRQIPNFHTGEQPPSRLSVAQLHTSISTVDVEKTAKALSSSPQSLFQAAYSLLLSSYLGTSDICFGTVFSGRTLPIPGIEDIAGPCLSTLPIRVDVSVASTLQELVQELNSINRKHLEHSGLPLRDIKSAGEINPRQGLFDTLLIWQQTLHSYDHTWNHVKLIDTVENLEFNFTLEIIPGVGNVAFKANYQCSLLPESQVDCILLQLQELVKAIIEDGKLPLSTVFSKLGRNLLSIENENPKIDLKPGTLSSPVEAIAVEDPNRLAIDFALSIEDDQINSHRVTYAEFNTAANKIGHALIAQGVLPDELVCICLEKSVKLYTSILATAKIGAGYLPVTPDVPLERLQRVLSEARVKILIANSTSKSFLASISNIHILYIDNINLTQFSAENIPSRSSPNNLSYCVFTSGSTGTPKGVLVTQENILSNLDVLEDLYPASGNSRFLQACSQAFDVSVFEIFFTWRVGACLCSATKDVLFRDIENAIRIMEVTHLSLTPTVAALIDPKNVQSVEFLVTAGEAVTQKVYNTWIGHGLYQGYGPSETTNICTVNPQVTILDSINNIGPPLKNTSAFVLAPGPEFRLIPRGGEGEFVFGGSQVFRGYMDEDQEKGKIIEHPEFGRLFRSGDFGRLMPDGSLAFSGRKDDQVKIRGQRVELGEINNVMLKSSDIVDCATMIFDGQDSSQRLVCFWTPPVQTSASLEILRSDPGVISKLFKNLEVALPAYMIPSALIPISKLPSTAQGKIDKVALAELYYALDVSYLNTTSHTKQPSLSHAWTGLELQIAETVAQATRLPLSEISPDVSFFSLGIDSISAISLSRLLREKTHTEIKIEVSDVLKHPSVARLAGVLSDRQANSPPSKDVVVENFDFGFDQTFTKATIEEFRQKGKRVDKILPCTPLQEAMLSAAELSSEIHYSNQVTFDVTGEVSRLQDCWQEMVQRHEILRTCFVCTDMRRYAYVQVILESYNLVFGDGSIKTYTKRGEMNPPFKIDVIRRNSSTKIRITIHHALYDGVALTVLYDEVEKLYQKQALPPPVQFSSFLQFMTSIEKEDSERFWDYNLKGFRESKFASHKCSASNKNEQMRSRVQRLAARTSLSHVEASIKRHSTTLLAVCHSAWSSLISSHLQQSDVVFGNVVSGRTVPVTGIERLVAPCFNTIPVRLSNIHNLTYLEAFRKLQNLNADSLPHQLFPLRKIQTKLSPSGSRLFDTLVILQQPPGKLNKSIWKIEGDDGTMDFPLVCEIVPKVDDDALEITLHSTGAVSAEDANSLLQGFEANLEAALENPRKQMLSASVKHLIELKEMDRRQKSSKKSSFLVSSTTMSSEEEVEIRDVISNFTTMPIEKISRDISIFRLGLDSISTVQVATRLRKQGHSVVTSDILEHPTIAELAAHLSQSDLSSNELAGYDFENFEKQYLNDLCAKNNIDSNHIEAVRPCTAIQQGMLAQSQHSEGREYVNSIWLKLNSSVDLIRFKAAWDEVRRRHEMLRTSFFQIEDAKHPFIMVTFANEYSPLPWSERETDDSQSLLIENLKQPWNLTIIERIVKLTVHHALYDAQSIHIVFSEVAKLYAGEVVVPETPISSLLGAILQNSQTDLEAKQTFWRRDENKIVVNRFPDLTPLFTSDNSTQVREISGRLSTVELEEACRKNGVTMQAAAQSTWARILAAYTGETSTTFGMTLSGRSICENANNICFPSIVTLPVRCDVTGTNAELLSRTMSSNAALHKHQFTPLTSIHKWSGQSRGKIFDTLFAYQKSPDNQENFDKPWKIIKEQASVDYAVSLEVQPAETGVLTLRITFRLDLVPVEHADLILKQYENFLVDTLFNPKGLCDVASEVENDLLSIMPAKSNILEDNVTLLHQYVERGAQTWPDRIALQFTTCFEPNIESKTWTYSELDTESNRVANLLSQRNPEPGQIVAICFSKCPQASFAIIGILKAGCVYLALDPSAPADRLQFILKDSGANLVFTAGAALVDRLQSAVKQEIIDLDTPGIVSACSSGKPDISRKILPQDVSYCLYTSGTTGTPKGCLLTHENAVQAMLSFQLLFAGHWTSESKWLQFASFHFDVSVLEQFWSWSVGICVVSAPRDLIFEDISGAIQRLGITHLDLTPSLARLLHPLDVPDLCKGVFITGGEQLKKEILDVWGEKACIYNGYGPTEATIGCTMYPRVPRNGKPSNIGSQFDNVGTFVLKPGTPLPALRGGVGELCVSGKLVAKGYLNRPKLTAERFPVLEGFNERVYRTGDLVRLLHNGNFTFLGRADDQVKLRGQRLELGEINEVIKGSSASLQEAITLVLKHIEQQKEQLVAFFVMGSTSEVDNHGTTISTIRDACKAMLPGYMVPTHFIPIKSLPLNANNKADSKQLAEMYNGLGIDDLQKLSHSNKQEQGWNEKEKTIASAIAKILQVEFSTLTRSSTIFELGLDSISIISFCRALQNAGLEGAKLSVVRSNPSIKALTLALLNNTNSDNVSGNSYVISLQNITAFSQKWLGTICRELEIQGGDIEAIAPCTPMQNGIIYRFLESDSPVYFNKFEFHLHCSVNTEKLINAWKRVVDRSQILRTVFVETNDGYAQVVLKKTDISWRVKAIAYDIVEKSIALREPFALSLKTASSDQSMYLQIFHGLYDGNSLTLLLRRVIAEYQEQKNVEYGPSFHSSLPYGPLSQYPGAQEFWKTHLEDWSPAFLPKVSELTKIITANRELTLRGFEDFRKRLGVTHNAIVGAAWISILNTVTPSNPTIGIVISGRSIDFVSANEVIGPLFNTVPFYAKITENVSAAEFISRFHDINMKMQHFQHTPLKEVQKWSPTKPAQALFDNLFVFQRSESKDKYFADGVWTFQDDDRFADYPLAFEATLNSDNQSLGLKIIAQGSFLTQYQADKLLQQLDELFQDILHNSGNCLISSAVPKYIRNTHNDTPTIQQSSPLADLVDHFDWTDHSLNIRNVISELVDLPVDSIDEHSSIFELGLDSIDVIKLSSRLRKQGIEIPVSVIVKCQTISNMTGKISLNSNHSSEAFQTVSIEKVRKDLIQYLGGNRTLPADVETILPATPLQQSLVNEMVKSNYARYFNVEAFKLSDEVTTSKLMDAVRKVIDQSPILRTTFIDVEDPRSAVSYAQLIHAKNSMYARELISSDIIPYGDSVEYYMQGFKQKSVSYAIEKQALLQILFIDNSKERFMLLAISHALYDGTSIQIFHEDIWRSYHASLATRPDPIPFIEQVFQSTTQDARSFWKTTLTNLPSSAFPMKEYSQISDSSAHRLERRSKISLNDVEAFCKSSKITLQTLGQTCWALVLSYLTGELDVIFGSVLSCRDSEEANEVMFPLMNTVAVRSVIHGSARKMLRNMQEISDTIRQYQHFPLSAAQAYALASKQNQVSRGNRTFFDTLFIYQGRRSSAYRESLYESVSGISDVEFPVCVELEIVNNEYLSWTTACKSIARSARETKQMIDALEHVLEKILLAPEAELITSNIEGISVCGLPRFSRLGVQRENSQILDESSAKIRNSWSATELNIRKALHELSGSPEDAIHKNLTIFHLGLDSILILKLPALLQTYGIHLKVSEILKHETVAAMAKAAEKLNPETTQFVDVNATLKQAAASINISSQVHVLEKKAGKIKEILPVTAGQLFMIRQWQSSQGSLFYPSFTYSVLGRVNKAKLEKAWRQLLYRHEILRTGFVEVGSEISQVIFLSPQNDVIYRSRSSEPLRRHDLSFPPINLLLEESDGCQTVLNLEIHHALYDGISLPMFVEELQSLYLGISLEEPESQFREFVAKSIAARSKLTKDKWESYLGKTTSYSREYPVRISNQKTEVFYPGMKISDIRQLAQRAGVSVDAFLLAAITNIYAGTILQKTNISSHVVFGIYLANRASFGEDLSNLAAPTLNLLPLRIENPLGRPILDIARGIQRDLQLIGSTSMSSASLEDIYNWTGVRVDFFVNILKDTARDTQGRELDSQTIFRPVEDLTRRKSTVEQLPNTNLPHRTDESFDAYQPSIDLEMRYRKEEVDVGLFAPSHMLELTDAQCLLENLLGFLASPVDC